VAHFLYISVSQSLTPFQSLLQHIARQVKRRVMNADISNRSAKRIDHQIWRYRNSSTFMLTSGSLAELVTAKTEDNDKNTEIADDFSLLLAVERISVSRVWQET